MRRVLVLGGKKFGRIDSDITISGNTLTLTNGLIDTGFSRLTADGEWVNNPGNERTSLKGKLRGQKIDAAAEIFWCHDAHTPVVI